MKVGLIALTLAVAVAGCSSNAPAASPPGDVQRMADLYTIEQIEVQWHKAASTHDVDLMMSLWADNATFTVGGQTYTGKAASRDLFVTKVTPFKVENHWVSDTPAYKLKATVDGDTGTLYFECHYIDVATKQVVNVVAADQKVARINGAWLITTAIGATPILTP